MAEIRRVIEFGEPGENDKVHSGLTLEAANELLDRLREKLINVMLAAESDDPSDGMDPPDDSEQCTPRRRRGILAEGLDPHPAASSPNSRVSPHQQGGPVAPAP
jgi:hypothetical protein